MFLRSLANIAKLEKFIDDDNANFAPWSTVDISARQRKKNDSKTDPIKSAHRRAMAANTSSNCSTSSSSASSPVTASTSRSLLKPKQEPFEPATNDLGSAEPRAFASVIKLSVKSKRHTVNVKDEDETEKPEMLKSTHDPDDDEKVEDEEEEEEEEEEEQSKEQEAKPSGKRSWAPGMRGRPPKGVKYIPISKLAHIQAVQRANYLRRMRETMLGLRQRGRPPKKPCPAPATAEAQREPEPEADPGPDQNDSSGEQSQPAGFERPSAAVRRGRSNLQMALNRLKRPPTEGESTDTFISTTATEIAKKSKPTSTKLVKHSSSVSSGSSPSSRSTTPTLSYVQMGASDDSSDRRCDMAVPIDSPPTHGEPEVPPPNDIWELGMKALLNYFGLCTPEEAKARRERRQERKRRSCYSTERKDFHYGRLDYYEQQQLQAAAVRTSKRPNQRPILYSPPVAVAKKRKHHQQIGTVRSSGTDRGGTTRGGPSSQRPPMRCNSVDSRDIFAAMSTSRCFVCNKPGTSLELSACTMCCNIYHISCHRSDVEEETQSYRQRDDLCPICLTADDDADDDGDK